MPRALRVILEGLPHHHIQRGNNRQPVFTDDTDRRLYRELLLEGSTRFGCAVHAWVFMRNHVHLLMTPEHQTSIAHLTQWMGARYVQWYNRRHERSGRLWQGRFYSSIVETRRYFLTCSRYIDQNPVRAGVCDDPGAFAWSSYARLALGVRDELVTEHDEYLSLGSTPLQRQQAYRALCDTPLDPATTDYVRIAGRRGEVVGSTPFVASIENRTGRPGRRLSHGGDRRLLAPLRRSIERRAQGG